MLDILEHQYRHGRSLVKNRYLSSLKREKWGKFHNDLYPMAEEYYHEFNPFFLYNVYSPHFYRLFNVFTVRDGMLTFADFIMANYNLIPKLGAKLFLIHPSLAPLVPHHVVEYFGTWSLSRPNPLQMSEAKKILIFASVFEQYFGDVSTVANKLREIKNLRPDVEIELYFPIRRNIFEIQQKESLLPFQLMNYIYEFFPKAQVKLHTSAHFLETNDFKNTYLVDLAPDNFIVSDNYVHYHVLSKGGSVHGILSAPPQDAIFDIALSFHHNLHISPLPKVQSIFTDLLFHKKQNPGKELLYDPTFQSLVRDGLKTNS